jgi:hypothetical protein
MTVHYALESTVNRADLTAIYPGYTQHETVTFLHKLAKIKSIHIYTISGRSFDSRPPAQEQVCYVLHRCAMRYQHTAPVA